MLADWSVLLFNVALMATSIAFFALWHRLWHHASHSSAETKRTWAHVSSERLFTVLIVSKSRNFVLCRRESRRSVSLSSPLHGAFAVRADVERLVLDLISPRNACASVHFVSVLPDSTSSTAGAATSSASDSSFLWRFAGDQCVSQRFMWLFFAECAEDAVLPDASLVWQPLDQLVTLAYDASLDRSLALPLRWFGRTSFASNPRDALQLLSKQTPALMPDPQTASIGDLRDYSLLDSCMYTFDQPGKGVRSSLVRALAQHFEVPSVTLARLCSFIEQFHQLSLMIDDIQDVSELRRNRPCAHVRFGVPETIGAAYTQLFRLMADIPTAFPVRSDAVTELVIDGCRACQRGQALDVTWRERRYCPSVLEWIDMARGKTAAPFELAARLVFLQTNALTRARLAAAKLVLRRDIEEEVVRLCGELGVYFQIRDDLINLTDEEYWKSHGVADDIHEKKYSYPICVMVEQRLPGFDTLLQMYAATPDRLSPEQVRDALAVIQKSGALTATRQVLDDMRSKILDHADLLQISAFSHIMKKLDAA
jgi:geranylgeranyl diphosphate synthase, type III